jgi:hypothetical protein
MLLEWAKNIASQPAFLALGVQGMWIWKKTHEKKQQSVHERDSRIQQHQLDT